MPYFYIIGLMSGTSADGIDAALVEIRLRKKGIKARLAAFVCMAYEPALREALLALCDPNRGRIPDLCALDSLLGERFAEAAIEVACRIGKAEQRKIAGIASHGHTVWHQPTPREVGGESARGTLQIGNPAVIAARTGLFVWSDFRSADMAAGGQGAPLVPLPDWILLSSKRESRAILNIGGIANVTLLPKGGGLDSVIAFDSGPGNIVMDALVRRFTGGEKQFDEDGAMAAAGSVNESLLKKLLSNPYFDSPPPKSTGREMFGESFARNLVRMAGRMGIGEADQVATATALTAESIALAYRKWLEPKGGAKKLILGGGGGKNAALVRMISERLPGIRIKHHSDYGIPDDAKEAMAFAILGYRAMCGLTGNVPSATGASHAARLGSMTPGPIPDSDE